jgi:TAP-like protein
MGQQYAELFARRVGRFVLDSNMDHSLDTRGFLRTEATAAEELFDEYVAWCARTPGCALHGTDVRALHHQLYAKIQRGEIVIPTPSGGWVFTVMDYLSMILSSGYGPSWYSLAEAMVELRDWGTDPSVASRGAPRLQAALAVAGKATVGRLAPRRRAAAAAADPAPGPVEPYPDPFAAIFCQDWRLPMRDIGDVRRMKELQERAAPDMHLSVIGWTSALGCAGLEDRVRNPQHTLRIRGADPMLFVNSRYDPATGYEWGVAAARQARQTLLTYDGWGHFAYGKSPCVVDKTDDYLFTGQVPAPGTHCPAVEPPAPDAPAARDARPSGVPIPIGPRPEVPGYGV